MQKFKLTCSKNERPLRQTAEKNLNVVVGLARETRNSIDINMSCELRTVGITVKIEAAGAIHIVLEVNMSVHIYCFFRWIPDLLK